MIKNDLGTTLLLIIKDNQKTLIRTLSYLQRNLKRNLNIKKILIIDNNGKDFSSILIKNYITRNKFDKANLITIKNNISTKQLMKIALKEIYTKNVIFLEPQLYIYTREISPMIENLKKAEIIIPNRFHAMSWGLLNKKQKKEILIANNIMKKYLTNNIKDPSIQYKGMRVYVLQEINNKIKENQDYWIQFYNQIRHYKIMQPPVEFNMTVNFKYFIYKNYLKD